MIVGDVRERSVKEVWNGERLKAYRKMFLEGRRKDHPQCGDCGQMTHGLPDNIDPYREELLQKLTNSGYFEEVHASSLIAKA